MLIFSAVFISCDPEKQQVLKRKKKGKKKRKNSSLISPRIVSRTLYLRKQLLEVVLQSAV